MVWVRLDDTFAGHPKILRLNDRAFRLHVKALCYAASQLTDGAIPQAFTRPGPVTRQLEEAGLWHPNGDGWTIHDWSVYNPSAKTIRSERRSAAERMRNARAARRPPPEQH